MMRRRLKMGTAEKLFCAGLIGFFLLAVALSKPTDTWSVTGAIEADIETLIITPRRSGQTDRLAQVKTASGDIAYVNVQTLPNLMEGERLKLTVLKNARNGAVKYHAQKVIEGADE